MARFMGSVRGSRGEATRLGGTNTGLQTICNGWHEGIHVVAQVIGEKDYFTIYTTGGSSHRSPSSLLLTINEDGTITRNDTFMTWKCEDEECGEECDRDYKTLAEAGNPYCPKCNGDMKLK